MQTFGILYIVATPIGNLGDMNPRGLEALRAATVIAAEDTRHSGRLLKHFALNTSLLPLHAHNEKQQVTGLIARLQAGDSVALISDAGTPLISDPGSLLIQEAHKAGIPVNPIPGPCAAITALSAAGFPADRFIFEGFLPAKATQRQKRLTALIDEPRTMVFYEAPHRILAFCADLETIFGPEREAVIAREITKTYETLHRGSLAALNTWLNADPNQQKGEFVVIASGAKSKPSADLTPEQQAILQILLDALPAKQAIELTVKITKASKNAVYSTAINTNKSKS